MTPFEFGKRAADMLSAMPGAKPGYTKPMHIGEMPRTNSANPQARNEYMRAKKMAPAFKAVNDTFAQRDREDAAAARAANTAKPAQQ